MLSCPPLLLYVEDSPSRLTQLRLQLPYLKAMGYQAICYAHIEESKEKAALFQEDFLFHDIEPTSVLLNAPLTKNEDVLAQIESFKEAHYCQQMEKYATLYQGGVIAVLSKKKHSNTIEQLAAQLNKLSVSENEFQDISLSLAGDFKTLIRSFLQTHAPTVSYGETFTPFVLQKLQRVAPQFVVRHNMDTRQPDAVVCVKDILDFEQRAIRVKRKLKVNCRLVMSGNSPLLVIPHVTDFETQRKIQEAHVGPTTTNEADALAKLTSFLEPLDVLPKAKAAELDFNDSISIATFVLPVGSEISLKGQKIVKLKLFASLNLTKFKSAYVIAQSSDGTHIVYYASDSYHFDEMFLQAGAFFEKAFHKFYHLVDNPDWKNTPTRLVYNDSKRQFYTLVHQKVARTLQANINQSKKFHHIAHTQGVLVFSFGCGEGSELTAVKQTLAQEQIDAQCIGFDLNPQNFEKRSEGIALLEGDMLQTGRLIIPHLHNNKLKVGLFIGSLVQQCLQGTQEAAKVLQQARDLDMIVITGYTTPFITKPIAKAIGWHVKATNLNHDMHETPLALKEASLPCVVGFYSLTRMNEADRKHYLMKRGIQRSSKALFDCLDLSLSDNPLRDINLFEKGELAQLKLIDLSWCALTQDEFNQLFSRIDSLNRQNLKIIFSGSEPWLNYLVPSSLKGKYVFLERTDYQPNHVNLFTQAEARLLRLYKEPPYRNSERFNPRPRKETEQDTVCQLLEGVIKQLDEVKEESYPPFGVSQQLVMTTLKLSGTSVKKATIFSVTSPLKPLVPFVDDVRLWSYDLTKTRLLVKTHNGERKLFRFKTDEQHKLLERTALSYGYSESTLMAQSTSEISWEKQTTKAVYNSSPLVAKYYRNHHSYLPTKIMNLITAQEDLLGKVKQHGLSLFSFGCGNAQDLMGVRRLFKEHDFKCNNAIGIDVNPDNFPKETKKDITLIQGNMQNLRSIISPYNQKNDLKIGLFIGSLANQCLPNGMVEAIDILQQAKSMDMIFISGVTKPLVVKWIAKGMGWHFSGYTTDMDMDESPAKTTNDKITFNMYTLRAMNDVDRKKYLIKRGTKRTKANVFHCLDLSMSADPVRDVNLFSDDELKGIKQIDLSWSAMNDSEFEAISKRICGLNNNELLITISKTETWFKKIKALKQFTFIIREDHAPDKVPTLAPHIARALGVYSDLPGRKTRFK